MPDQSSNSIRRNGSRAYFSRSTRTSQKNARLEFCKIFEEKSEVCARYKKGIFHVARKYGVSCTSLYLMVYRILQTNIYWINTKHRRKNSRGHHGGRKCFASLSVFCGIFVRRRSWCPRSLTEASTFPESTANDCLRAQALGTESSTPHF